MRRKLATEFAAALRTLFLNAAVRPRRAGAPTSRAAVRIEHERTVVVLPRRRRAS